MCLPLQGANKTKEQLASVEEKSKQLSQELHRLQADLLAKRGDAPATPAAARVVC
jgi:hypothetical protein